MKSTAMSLLRPAVVAVALLTAGAGLGLTDATAAQLTYQEAMDIALQRSSRSEIIHGNLEVAERQYFANRVNFVFPEISLRGSAPFERKETYDFLQNTNEKVFGQNTTMDLDAYIDLNQNLMTGGSLTLRAYLRSNDWEYPQLRRLSDESLAQVYVEEKRRLGSFDLTFSQPILQPSQAKNELKNYKDELEIAKLSRAEETSTLKQEIAQAYVGTLEQMLQKRIADEKYESARLQAEIDSAKFSDGVVSEEAWLASSSAHLDAELVRYDVQNELTKKRQDLAILLELENPDSIELVIPETVDPMSPDERQRLIAAADRSVPILKAEYSYLKAKRAADFERKSLGLQGTLSANYIKDVGRVDITDRERNDLDLDTWGVKVEFTYPLWDGGASGANVRAKDIEAKKAKVEMERAQKAAKAEIRALGNSIDVSSRKLTVLKKQIELSRNRLTIAQERYDNGEISRIAYLAISVEYLEAQKKYLEELKNYLVDTYVLEGKFTG